MFRPASEYWRGLSARTKFLVLVLSVTLIAAGGLWWRVSSLNQYTNTTVVEGEITSIQGESITVKDKKDVNYTVTVPFTTVVLNVFGVKTDASGLALGDVVFVLGVKDAEGTDRPAAVIVVDTKDPAVVTSLDTGKTIPLKHGDTITVVLNRLEHDITGKTCMPEGVLKLVPNNLETGGSRAVYRFEGLTVGSCTLTDDKGFVVNFSVTP